MNKIRNNIPKQNFEKAKEVILCVLQKLGICEAEYLQNLMYFIDFDYYEKYEEQLMGLIYYKNERI